MQLLVKVINGGQQACSFMTAVPVWGLPVPVSKARIRKEPKVDMDFGPTGYCGMGAWTHSSWTAEGLERSCFLMAGASEISEPQTQPSPKLQEQNSQTLGGAG